MNSQASDSTQKTPISIVLVNYKTKQLTSACLELLQANLKNYHAQVWVVDNDSADESTAYLRSLNWINLIERKPPGTEPGFVAHGLALDTVLERIDTDFLFLLHTDTLIYNPAIFDIMLEYCLADDKVAAVGCVEQIDRGRIRSCWRLVTRFCSHYFRRMKISLGFKSKDPKPYVEKYLKSFCALWNCRTLKEHGMTFMMANRTPGYEAQDKLALLGYKFVKLSPSRVFRYLDHVEAGTVSAIGGYHQHHRRVKKYQSILEKLDLN